MWAFRRDPCIRFEFLSRRRLHVRMPGSGRGEGVAKVVRPAQPRSAAQETRTVLGAGCSEMAMARAVEEEAKKTPGKKALAMEGFARALRQIPAIICENAGLDSADLVTKLTAEHYNGNRKAGLGVCVNVHKFVCVCVHVFFCSGFFFQKTKRNCIKSPEGIYDLTMHF